MITNKKGMNCNLKDLAIKLARERGLWKDPENLNQMTVFEFCDYMLLLIENDKTALPAPNQIRRSL